MVRAALNAILLMKLYWYMNDILMEPVCVASKQFSEIYPNVKSQVDLMMHMNHREYPGAENIVLNMVEHLDEVVRNN